MRVHVPGDKSLTQRALILSALAEGESRISGLLFGGDAESTANALRALGAGIPPIPSDGSEITVQGVGLGGLRSPGSKLEGKRRAPIVDKVGGQPPLFHTSTLDR